MLDMNLIYAEEELRQDPLAWENYVQLVRQISLEERAEHNEGQIRKVYESECAHVVVNPRLLRKIVEMEARFVNKKEDHIKFFGGTLTGVEVVRFTAEDRDRLFTDILEVDDRQLEERLYALKDASGAFVINREWKISSDVFNLSVIWLLHAIEVSPFLTPDQKREGKIHLCMYMLYKFLTSRLYRHFPYPADKEVAQAAYAQLSYKFALKEHGSWGAVLRHLATNATKSDGIHGQTIAKMDDDVKVRNMLADIQGRPRDMLKNFYGSFLRVHKEGGRIKQSSAVVDIDGEMILRDKTKSLGNYTRYIKSVISDQNSFIRQELVDVICKIMHTMSPKMLDQSLQWASRNFGHTKEQSVERAIDLIAEHAFAYLSDHRELLNAKGDLANLVSKLRGAYMSSRSTDALLMEIRDLVGSIVEQATKSRNESAIAAARTGFMIYVIVRMFSMRHYTS